MMETVHSNENPVCGHFDNFSHVLLGGIKASSNEAPCLLKKGASLLIPSIWAISLSITYCKFVLAT